MTEQTTHTCHLDENGDIDEPATFKALASKFATAWDSVARCAIDGREAIALRLYYMVLRHLLKDRLALLMYACEYPTRRKRKPVDVAKMVETWKPLLIQLALAHDFDERDAASSALDEQLSPIVNAPVKQIREFYRELTANLKADPKCPFALWSLFDFWGEKVLAKVDDKGVLELKKDLAGQIAERSMADIPREDWINSMIGALMWRDPVRLEEINKELAGGAKPRVRGRESCLFLEVAGKEVML